MTSRCANPACAIPLRYLRDGRLFQFEVRPKFPISGPLPENQGASRAERLVRKVSHFWLCGKCASTLTLAFDALKGVVVKPRPTS
jgi:hypothetical protein